MLTAGEGLNFLGRFLQDASVIEVYHFKSDVFEFFAGLASFIFKAYRIQPIPNGIELPRWLSCKWFFILCTDHKN